MNIKHSIGEKLAMDLDGTAPLSLGKEYTIYTVTYHHQGTLVEIGDFHGHKYIRLDNSLFIQESGDLEDYLKTKKPKSADRQGTVCIALQAVTHWLPL